ncbi:MAG TPA: MAPEG family protein [Burkholderiales bacterium]|nr:MAPEG family protein [Burkholderiales bacterium]
MTSHTSAFSLSAWVRERRLAVRVIALGTVSWAIVFGAAWRWWPTALSVPPADRVSYVLQLGAAPAIVTLLMACACLRLFDTARAEDPRLGAESERFKINQRVLTNTVEQSWIFVPLALALSVRLAPGQLKLLPIAVSVWCAGRIMFWVGYHVAPHWRAPGFDWTFNTSCLLAGWFLYTLV